MEESKEKYYTKLTSRLAVTSRLADPLTSPKTYWSILNNKKKPCIPLLFHENKFITDFKEKAELFNHFFCKSMPLFKQQLCLSYRSTSTHKQMS